MTIIATAVYDYSGSGLSVIVAPTKTIGNARVGACQANVRVNSNGTLEESNATGGIYTFYEDWLESGSNTEVWVERIIYSSDTLDTDSGSGRRPCTGINTFGITESTIGNKKTATIDLNFYDASTGGNLLDTQTVTLSAEYIN